MILAIVPRSTTPELLAARGLSPGLMSAGLGSVPAEQTYLDITQGNRVFDSLYDEQLPPLGRDCSAWPAVVHRADSAPAEIVPGLLQAELRRSGVAVRRGVRTSCTFSAPPSVLAGNLDRKKLREDPPPDRPRAFEVRKSSLGALTSLYRRLQGDGLLIALEEPPPGDDEQLAIGLAGAGFSPGNLTSDSTRTDGYVLSTDLAPTILARFGMGVPSQVSGEALRTEGSVDPGAVEALGRRMAAVPGRRGPVIGFALIAWCVVAGLVAVLGRGRPARVGVQLLALAVIYLPLLLLLGAALEASQGVEQLLVVFGSPALAGVTVASVGGYRALGLASAVTVVAYAIDMIAGSPLTSTSLLGPNPGLGVRFYGIGNELEALLAVLVVAGTGSLLAGFAPNQQPRRVAAVFLAAGILSAFVFAAGRFGADVGAAIVFPLGAAVAAATVAARSRRAALLVLAVPVLAVALLALIDLVSGANAHLTRSVLDAGGLDDLGDVAQRRLELSANSFARPIVYLFLPLIVAAALAAYLGRRRIEAWLAPHPSARAGLIGALAATILGTLANDSGALLLEIGSAYLLVFLGYAWAQADDPSGRYP